MVVDVSEDIQDLIAVQKPIVVHVNSFEAFIQHLVEFLVAAHLTATMTMMTMMILTLHMKAMMIRTMIIDLGGDRCSH